MLVLALDTATSAVVAGVVELTDAVTTRAARVARDPSDARKHGELLMPGVLAACAEGGIALRDVDAVVAGVGPGPFTGLRVGMVTAAALGDALDVPVHGVCSLDAIAVDAAVVEPFAVLTDARRREVYWAAYDGSGARTAGPYVDAPAAAAVRARALGATAAAGSPEHAAALGVAVHAPAVPTPAGLVAVAAPALRSGTSPSPLVPLYLRRPDAAVPGPRKKVRA